MKRKLAQHERDRLEVRDRFLNVLHFEGCKCLWNVWGGEQKMKGDISESQLRGYVIRGRVYIMHLYTNGGMDIYGPTDAPKAWDQLEAWVKGEHVAATPAETSTPLTVEPM